MKLLRYLRHLLISLMPAFATAEPFAMKNEPPNLVVVSWHDVGRQLGAYGAETVRTPRVDAFADEAMVFDQAFTTAPVCGPSRSSMLTGLYPTSNGMYGQCHEGYRFKPGVRHLAARLRERGYATGVAGFQHEAVRGEASALGFDAVLADRPEEGIWFPPVPRAEKVVDAALGWLDEARPQPFYLQVGFWEAHRPYLGPGVEPDDPDGVTIPPFIAETPFARKDFAQFQGAVRAADEAFGKLLDGLEARGLEENTLVVFWTDHGIPVPRAKLTGYDPGLEIAWMLRWPGHVRPGRSERLVSNVDFLPTLHELFGWAPDPAFQGRSFADACGDFEGAPPRDAVFAAVYYGDLRVIRTRTHKLIRNLDKLREYVVPVDLEDAGHYVLQREKGMRKVEPVECYNLAVDPLEQTNLFGRPEHADTVARLRRELLAWMRSCDDPALAGPTLTPQWADFLEEVQ